jgi:hypothetical protein
MKHFKPITIKMDEASLVDLEVIVAAERKKNPGYAISTAAVIRRLIHEKARRVPRETSDTSA